LEFLYDWLFFITVKLRKIWEIIKHYLQLNSTPSIGLHKQASGRCFFQHFILLAGNWDQSKVNFKQAGFIN